MTSQNDLEYLIDQVDRGLMTAAEANVEKVRMARIYLVTMKLSRPFRAALSAGVKSGKLGHIAKDGHKPEAYFHPAFEYMVPGKRNAHEREILRRLAGVLA